MINLPTNPIKLEKFSILGCQGKDTKTFLQGQLTCNLDEITDSQARLGSYCDHKGRVQATFYLWQHHEIYYFILPQLISHHFLNELKKFAVFSKITSSDLTPQFSLYGYIGKESFVDFGDDYPEMPYQVFHKDETTLINIPGDIPRILAITPRSTDSRRATGVYGASSQQTRKFKCEEYIWQLIDIYSGIAFITKETIGLFTPHDLNYQLIGAINFKKGCYRGQEIIARMHYRGKLKQHLYHAFADTACPLSGTAILDVDKKSVGTVINSTANEEGSHMLVCLQQSAKKDNFVFLESDLKSSLKFLELSYQIPSE